MVSSASAHRSDFAGEYNQIPELCNEQAEQSIGLRLFCTEKYAMQCQQWAHQAVWTVAIFLTFSALLGAE
eukprot:scaffold241052_cov38-Prasinocladus_malaysianus.AAC.1